MASCVPCSLSSPSMSFHLVISLFAYQELDGSLSDTDKHYWFKTNRIPEKKNWIEYGKLRNVLVSAICHAKRHSWTAFIMWIPNVLLNRYPSKDKRFPLPCVRVLISLQMLTKLTCWIGNLSSTFNHSHPRLLSLDALYMCSVIVVILLCASSACVVIVYVCIVHVRSG